jgi:uncharacterized protein YfaT (DUF1175 family)
MITDIIVLIVVLGYLWWVTDLAHKVLEKNMQLTEERWILSEEVAKLTEKLGNHKAAIFMLDYEVQVEFKSILEKMEG